LTLDFTQGELVMTRFSRTSVHAALGMAFAVSGFSAQASEFQVTDLPAGYQLVASAKAGEGDPAPAGPVSSGEAAVRLEYDNNQKRVVRGFGKSHGKYLGSGNGTVSGVLDGTVLWDLYEDQDDPQLHRAQFVGRITGKDGSAIAFETSGYFVARKGDDHFWDLTSAVYLHDAKGPGFRRFAGNLAVWEGYTDTRTYSARYRLRLLGKEQ